jgi:hypothetical protein
MNVIFWREAAAAEPVSVSSQQRQPALLVIEGGRDQLSPTSNASPMSCACSSGVSRPRERSCTGYWRRWARSQ